jgi:hypothetical protein
MDSDNVILNPGSITIEVPGTYYISYTLACIGNATTPNAISGPFAGAVLLNGAINPLLTIASTQVSATVISNTSISAPAVSNITSSAIITLSAGDILQLAMFANTISNAQVTFTSTDASNAFLSVFLLDPSGV